MVAADGANLLARAVTAVEARTDEHVQLYSLCSRWLTIAAAAAAAATTATVGTLAWYLKLAQ
jgi:hypothetical protein